MTSTAGVMLPVVMPKATNTVGFNMFDYPIHRISLAGDSDVAVSFSVRKPGHTISPIGEALTIKLGDYNGAVLIGLPETKLPLYKLHLEGDVGTRVILAGSYRSPGHTVSPLSKQYSVPFIAVPELGATIGLLIGAAFLHWIKRGKHVK